MTTQANIEPPVNETTADQVYEYLSNHPNFFNDYPQLVAELRLTHASGSAVSLMERQVQVLREQNQDLANKLLKLVDVARENDHLSARMHSLTLGLLQATSLAELLDTLEDRFRNDFEADAVAVHMAGLDDKQLQETGAHKLIVDEKIKQLFNTVFSDGKPQCGHFKQDKLEFLFREQAATVESAVVIPLGDNASMGLLTIGSREVNRFNPCMDTLFLSHLGELLTVSLRRLTSGN